MKKTQDNKKNIETCNERVVKTMRIEDEKRIAELIIGELKKSQCTLTNFEGISKNVHQFFNDNATLDN